MIYVTKSPEETRKLGGFLLDKFLKFKSNRATVIALEGELGAGKTTFVQGLAKKLKIKDKIKSPTFNLMKHYKAGDLVLYHLDCYRLRDHRDLEVLGIKDIISNSNSIVLIEWSDRVKKILPKKYVNVHIDHISKKERKITIK